MKHANMGTRGMPNNEFFQDDGVHLSPAGSAKLAGNIKATLGESLGAKKQTEEQGRRRGQPRWDSWEGRRQPYYKRW